MTLLTETNMLFLGICATIMLFSFGLGIAFSSILLILYKRLIFDLFIRLRSDIEEDIKKSRDQRVREALQDQGINSSSPVHPDYSDEDQVGTVGRFEEDPMTGAKYWKES